MVEKTVLEWVLGVALLLIFSGFSALVQSGAGGAGRRRGRRHSRGGDGAQPSVAIGSNGDRPRPARRPVPAFVAGSRQWESNGNPITQRHGDRHQAEANRLARDKPSPLASPTSAPDRPMEDP
jgi:hypothetical protein